MTVMITDVFSSLCSCVHAVLTAHESPRNHSLNHSLHCHENSARLPFRKTKACPWSVQHTHVVWGTNFNLFFWQREGHRSCWARAQEKMIFFFYLLPANSNSLHYSIYYFSITSHKIGNFTCCLLGNIDT